MSTSRFFILISALAALIAGLQMSRQGCPACAVLPKYPEAAHTSTSNSTTPNP
ncbi:MAG: hypothetical protein IPK32_04625 [Verrucomicrobiaceae bacterium]|nr:hypothetical protein [Verrucomicrobiaceae bacterium]